MKSISHIALLFLITNLFISNCTNHINDKYIKRELKKIIRTKMEIPREIIPFSLSDSITFVDYIGSKYKIIHFIDSMKCSGCYIRSLYKWKSFFAEANRISSPIIIIFNTNDLFEIKTYMEKYELNLPYFLDPDKNFKKINKNIPRIEELNTFLTRNDTIILVGNPVENIKLKDLFLSEIKK